MANINKYISKFATNIVESKSSESRYYQIENNIIRVSTHIGKNSDGDFQIVEKPNGYIIYQPSTGTINIFNYRQVQEFIRTLSLFPIFKKVTKEVIFETYDNQSVLGIPISALSDGQLNNIKKIVDKVRKTKKVC